jgi:hypothetical protein
VSIGERWLVGVATGTAIFLSPMAAPPVPRVAAGEAWSNKAELAEMQKKLQETSKRNREQFCVQPMATSTSLVVILLCYYFIHIKSISTIIISYNN